MKYIIGGIFLVGIMTLSATSEAGAPGMKEGLWEITTSTEMSGMPFKSAPVTITHCYTKEDVKNGKEVIPKQEGRCTITDMKQSGSKISWKIKCTGQNRGKGEGEMVFKGDTAYEGYQKFAMQGDENQQSL
jgi:hypothetical protein